MGSAGEASVASDTFAKAPAGARRRRGGRPAFRHKDFGLWQTWTWAKSTTRRARSPQGLIGLGLDRGDTIAIVGANRPKLYWSITAAQMVGAIPVPVYADAVADELAAVLDHSEASDRRRPGPGAGRQDPLDPRAPAAASGTSSTTSRAALPTMTSPASPRSKPSWRKAARRSPTAQSRPTSTGASTRAEARTRPSILYTSGTTGRSKGVVLSGERSIAAARYTVAFDKLTDRDEVLAYLPLAWVGDHYLNYAQGYVAGFCMACPESADTAASDLREIGPTYHFAPPRVFEALLTRVQIRMEDASALQAMALSPLHGRREALGRKDRQRRGGPARRAARLRASATSSSTRR